MKREIAVKAEITRLLTAGIGLLLIGGVISLDQQNLLLDNIELIVVVVFSLISIGATYYTRQRVTPVDDPKTADGAPLVRVQELDK